MTEKRYDVPTYPELGHVYPGDYYQELPFGDYIHQEKLPQGESVFDIRDYGAVAEEGVLNTEAIRAAVSACAQAGGGTILVAGGNYTTGSIGLPSHTTLFIAADSGLIASRNADELIFDAGETEKERGSEAQGGALIYAIGEKEIRITGGGRISGSGEWYVYEPRELPALKPFPMTRLPRRDQKEIINQVPGTIRYYYRQRIRYAEDKYNEGKGNLRRPAALVWIQGCQNVTIDNCILHDAMSWTLHIDCCDHVTVRNLVIDDNRHVANSDGVDVSGSTDVSVHHCFISCADDGIVIKNPAHTRRKTEHIRISDCTVLTVMNSFKIGTETRYDIEDVLVEDCYFCLPDIFPGSVSGISLESCDGTNLKNITIRNITMNKICCPLYILLNRRNRYKEAPWGGSISQIHISNIKVTEAEVPSIITGFLDRDEKGNEVRKAPSDISIQGFEVTYRDNQEIIEIPEEIPEYYTDYPESNSHGDVDAYGIWIRHADRVSLSDVHVTPRNGNTRVMLQCYDVT